MFVWAGFVTAPAVRTVPETEDAWIFERVFA
jgi:hypothetical protein